MSLLPKSMERLEKARLYIDILTKKYIVLRNESVFMHQELKKQARYVSLVISAILSVLGYVFLHYSDLITQLNAFNISPSKFAWFGTACMIAVSYYLCVDVLDSFFGVIYVGARLQVLEEQINEIAQKKLLIWESEVQDAAIDKRSPSRILFAFFQFLLIAIMVIIIPWIISQAYFDKSSASEQRLWAVLLICSIIMYLILVGSYFYIALRWRKHGAKQIRKILKGEWRVRSHSGRQSCDPGNLQK